ncbi:hypothetical protein ACHAXM_010396 [Skeletonema potamos]
MSYSPPLSERIRIQFEILCENATDFMASSHLKKPILVLVSIAVFMTMRNSRRSIKNAKMGGLMAGNSPYASPYGSATTAGATGKKGWLSGLFGKKTTGASSTLSSYGGLSSPYATSGSSYGASMGLRGGATGTSPYGSTLGGGLGTGTTGSYGTGSSSFGSNFGGTGSFGSISSLGGSTMGFGSSLTGGGGTGKATADLADSNPSSVMIVDPSIHFYDYGGSVSFGGQIETVQAPDSPGMVTQVLSQPGQNKVLVIDGGGQMNSAILDGQAASTAMRNGWKGIIVYGAVRNAATLQGLSIGVKALGTNPRKGTGSMGQRGGVVNLSNAQLQSGWWVFADKDGILISQTDISGQGGYGSSGSFGATSYGGTGMSSFGASSMGGTSTFGGTSSYGAGALGGSTYGSGSTIGGLGGSSTLGGSSYGGSSFGGTSYGAGSLGGSSLGGTSPYGSTGYGSTGGGLGAYGRSTTGGLGGYSAGGYNTGGYGSSFYGSSYSAKKKKNKVFKILLASSIAAIVWIVCLR